jgi:hypothetical protein
MDLRTNFCPNMNKYSVICLKELQKCHKYTQSSAVRTNDKTITLFAGISHYFYSPCYC